MDLTTSPRGWELDKLMECQRYPLDGVDQRPSQDHIVSKGNINDLELCHGANTLCEDDH